VGAVVGGVVVARWRVGVLRPGSSCVGTMFKNVQKGNEQARAAAEADRKAGPSRLARGTAAGFRRRRDAAN